MQIRKIANKDFFNATVVTADMVIELAKGLGLSEAYIAKTLTQKLAKASQARGAKSTAVGDLPDGKLRTVILQKLQQPNDLVTGFASPEDSFEFEFHCFPDEVAEPDINAAGANKRSAAPRKANTVGSVVQKGNYIVVKRGLKCDASTDPEKFNLWQHVWTCASFEEYYANAPKKAVTRTGRIITAASEMAWAIKSGWIKPFAAEAEQAA